MCLSTAYYNKKSDDRIAAEYVASISVEGSTVVLTDVMGLEMRIEGRVSFVDLTGGTVIISTEDAA